ncbi:transcriptional antiterminator, BglG family [Alkalibacterium sp. AK22]|uniref:BglG family transcription antiterminator n=1 Tax=Alkalibacterium sp. AK22 TaxID=1229520 RepID=UPI00044BAEDD|nr:PTS sugar transporter subunit IIA [Alkalibacterium sp. AK22]EXJ23608.1 transcriptional antiterminator, BglG family [Alkalibacterium sp. AK22]
MLTLREVMVAHQIATKPDVTLEDLADQFELSKRTIRYDLENIEENLFARKVFPEYIAILKDMDEQKRVSLRSYIEELHLSEVTLAPQERYLILKYTLILLGKLNLTKISKELQVSRMTVKNDFNQLLKELAKSQLSTKLKYKDGYILTGKEERVRQFQRDILENISSHSFYNELLFSDLLDKFLAELDLSGITEFLYNLQQQLRGIFTDSSYARMKNSLMVTVIRNKAGKQLTAGNRTVSSTDEQLEALKELKVGLEEAYAITISHEDIEETWAVLKQCRFVRSEIFEKDYSIEIDRLVYQLVQAFGYRYGVDLTKDKELFDGLNNHLKPLMRQSSFDDSSSIMFEEIQSEYPGVYETVAEVLQETPLSAGACQLPQQAVPLISVHFAAALHRQSVYTGVSKKVLIVCSQGIGVSKLLEEQLSSQFNVDVQDVIPAHYLKHYSEKANVDLIISTVDLNADENHAPVLKVSPLLTQKDLKQLESEGIIRHSKKIELSKLLAILSENLKEGDSQDLITALKHNFGRFLVDDLSNREVRESQQVKEAFVQVADRADSFKEAISLALKPLVDHKYIEQAYVSEVIHAFAENGSYMFVAEGIAIPHARSEQVKETGFGILKLHEPVRYSDNQTIDMLICFSSRDNLGHLDALINIVDYVKTPEFLSALRSIRTADELARHILSINIETEEL